MQPSIGGLSWISGISVDRVSYDSSFTSATTAATMAPTMYPQGAVEIGLGGHVEGHGDLWKQFEQADDERRLSGGDGEDEANEPDFEAGEIGLGGQFAAVGGGGLAHGADDGFGLGALKTRGLDVTGGGKGVEVGGGHAMKINDRGFARNPLTGFSTTAASRVR